MYADRISQPVAPLRTLGSMSAPTLMAQEYLPFTVRIARDAPTLSKAVDIRHEAYARHLAPEVVEALRQPEAMDSTPGVAVLLAESKLDGTPLGTMRIQTNSHRALALEQSIRLPEWMQGKGLAEASRLGITNDRVGRMVKTVLFKAYYLFCLQNDVRYMVITARSPIDRQYDRLLFKDVFPGLGFVPLEHVFNLPHRIMYLDVLAAQKQWEEAEHPLLDYMCHTHHPDLKLGRL